MQANVANLTAILGNNSTLLTPRIQRPYVWEAREWQGFWDGLIEARERKDYFLGATILQPASINPVNPTTFDIIDGQQRFTTSSIFLLSIVDIMKRLDPTFVNDLVLFPVIRGHLYNFAGTQQKLIISKANKNNLPNLEDYKEYKNLCDNIINGVNHQLDPRSLVKHCFDFFCGKIINYLGDQITKDQQNNVIAMNDGVTINQITASIQTIWDGFSQYFKIVSISLDSDENAYEIFANINGTGVALTQADLIRNFVASNLADQDIHFWMDIQAPLPPNSIENFFFDFITWKDADRPNRKRIYEKTKSYLTPYRDQDGNEFTDQLADIAQSAQVYQQLQDSAQIAPALGADYRNAVEAIQRVDMRTSYSAILGIHELKRNGVIQDLVQPIKHIESFLIRRLICEVPTNSLGKRFADLCGHIRAFKANQKVNFADYLHDYLTNIGTQRTARWPDDQEVRTALQTMDIYRKATLCRLILERVELAMNPTTQNLNTMTIEHIMPQDINQWLNDPNWMNIFQDDIQKAQAFHDQYMHRIGNLTLVPQAHQPLLSNEIFSNKISMHTANGFHIMGLLKLNDWVCQQATWSETEIDQRADNIANRVIAIWPR